VNIIILVFMAVRW